MLVNNYNSILKRKSGNWQPETITQKNRIEADGGVVIDLPWINRVIYTLKALGIYSNAKLLTDANFGVRKDISGAVSKLYDISGNNNDAIQTTGASQPIWSLVGGGGIITYDGVNDYFTLPFYTPTGNKTILNKINPTRTTGIDAIFGLYLLELNNRIPRHYNGTAYLNSIQQLPVNTTVSIETIFSQEDNKIKWYTSGIYISYRLSPSFSATTVHIGTYTNSRYFKGQINSSTIFNIALTQDQITTLYNLGL